MKIGEPVRFVGDKKPLPIRAAGEPTVFDIFADRTASLVERWKKYEQNHPEIKDISKVCIQGVLREINDDYTQYLIGDTDPRD